MREKGFVLITVLVFLSLATVLVLHDFYSAQLQLKAVNSLKLD